MKKIITLTFAVLSALTVTAQRVAPQITADIRPYSSKVNQEIKMVKSEIMPMETIMQHKAAKKVTSTGIDTLYYVRDYGSFFYDGPYPLIVTDTIMSTNLYDYSTRHTDYDTYWGIPTEEGMALITGEANEQYITIPYYNETPISNTEWYAPTLLTADEENIYQTYTYASGLREIYLAAAAENPEYAAYYASLAEYADPAILFRPDYPMLMTTCAMYTDSVFGTYDDYMVGDGAGGYAMGTTLKAYGNQVDTFLVIFDNLTTLKFDTARLSIWSNSANMIAADSEVKLEVVEAGINSSTYQWQIGSTVLATATATQNDLYNLYQYSNGAYSGDLIFAFGTKNAFGGFSPASVTKTGMFAIRIIVNSAKNNFGMFTDYYYPDSQSLFYVAGSLYGYKGLNIHLSLKAQFVDAANTAVENVEDSTNNDVNKVVVDGQVLIQKDGKTYNVLGAEVK